MQIVDRGGSGIGMLWTWPQIALFAIFAACVAGLVVTFPAVWRWNAEAKKLQKELEEAQRDPGKASHLADRLLEALDRKTSEIQVLKDHVEAVRASQPINKLDLQAFAEQVVDAIATEGRRSLIRDVIIAAIFMVLGIFAQELFNLVRGR